MYFGANQSVSLFSVTDIDIILFPNILTKESLSPDVYTDVSSLFDTLQTHFSVRHVACRLMYLCEPENPSENIVRKQILVSEMIFAYYFQQFFFLFSSC